MITKQLLKELTSVNLYIQDINMIYHNLKLFIRSLLFILMRTIGYGMIAPLTILMIIIVPAVGLGFMIYLMALTIINAIKGESYVHNR